MSISNRFGFRLGLLAIIGQLAACQTVPPRVGFSREQVKVLESQGFQEVDGNYELGLENRILFEFDRSDLRADMVAMLGTLSSTLVDVGIRGVMVEGHTDSAGADDYNATLSLQRAETVRFALAGNSMNYDAIRTQGLGEADPIASNDSAEGRQQNRRVVIVVTALDAAPL